MQLPSPAHIDAELARRAEVDLLEFVREAWGIIEPGTPFVENWHHACICEHLQAVTDGQIRNLLINIPPRHTKSRIVSVMWPAWLWITRPAHQWLFASYAAPLALRDAVYARTLIDSPWYQRYWRDRFSFRPDQNMKTAYTNTKGGHRISTGVGGAATGEGGDTLVIDDPHNIKEIHSRAARDSAKLWYSQVWCSRMNDPKQSTRVCIMQRAHGDDLAKHIMDKGDVVHLKIQSEAVEPRVITGPVSGGTWKREDDEVLWHGRFDAPELAQAKKDLGTWAYAAQHQQEPAPTGGGIFKVDWWKQYTELPELIRVIQWWDTAFKTKETNDWCVCATWAETVTGYYLIDLYRARLEFPELKRMTGAKGSQLWGPNQLPVSAVLIEDAASGQSLIQEARRETKLPIIAVKVDRDKVARAHAVSPTIEAGKCYVPEDAPWLAVFLQEHAEFPNSEYDDQVDTTTGALAWLVKRGHPWERQVGYQLA